MFALFYLAALAVAVVLFMMHVRECSRNRPRARFGVGTTSRFDILRNIRRLFEDGGVQTVAAPTVDVSGDASGNDGRILELNALLGDLRLPSKCRESAVRLCDELTALRLRAKSRPAGDSTLLDIARLQERHLPDLLRRYLGVPDEHRAEIFRRTGKSASYHLATALEMMSRRADELSLELAAGLLDDFATGTRFVETRYGRGLDPFA